MLFSSRNRVEIPTGSIGEIRVVATTFVSLPYSSFSIISLFILYYTVKDKTATVRAATLIRLSRTSTRSGRQVPVAVAVVYSQEKRKRRAANVCVYARAADGLTIWDDLDERNN